MQPGIRSAFMSDMSRVLLTFVNARIYERRQTGKEGNGVWQRPHAAN